MLIFFLKKKLLSEKRFSVVSKGVVGNGSKTVGKVYNMIQIL